MSKKIDVTLINSNSDSLFFGSGFLKWTIDAAKSRGLVHMFLVTSQLDEATLNDNYKSEETKQAVIVIDMRGDARASTAIFIEELHERFKNTSVVQAIILHDDQY